MWSKHLKGIPFVHPKAPDTNEKLHKHRVGSIPSVIWDSRKFPKVIGTHPYDNAKLDMQDTLCFT